MAQQSGVDINLSNIHIILVRPQMGENIGAVARVMLNFGFTNLRIVAPRDGWPNERAKALSVGAYNVVERAKIYEDLESATSDLELIYAASARMRFMNKQVLAPEEIVKEINSNIKIGILIGPESSGLSNEDITLANKIITIPVNPEFSSINIAQATGVISYEITKSLHKFDKVESFGDLATSGEITSLYNHLEKELDARNFFKVASKREGMIINIRNMWKRISNFTSQDVRTLRGIIKCLTESEKIE